METNALAAQALQVFRALIQDTRPERALTDMQQGEKLALVLLEEAGGRMLPGELSQAMGTSTARTAALLRSLEAKGLVTRQQDTADRPAHARLPDAVGHRRTAPAYVRSDAADAAVFAALGEADSRELVRLLGRLREICPSLSTATLS